MYNPVSPEHESASSQAIGILFLVAITILLAILVFLMIQFSLPYAEPEVPVIFEITRIGRQNPDGPIYDDSYVVLVNRGKLAYDNRKLYAKTYANGELLPIRIPQMNGYFMTQFEHYGIQHFGGEGSGNYYWYPDDPVNIDYSRGTFRKGDIIKIEVYDKTTDRIISRDTWPHTNGRDAQWFYRYFLNHRAA